MRYPAALAQLKLSCGGWWVVTRACRVVFLASRRRHISFSLLIHVEYPHRAGGGFYRCSSARRVGENRLSCLTSARLIANEWSLRFVRHMANNQQPSTVNKTHLKQRPTDQL